MLNARRRFKEMKQKARQQQQEREKSWRPIIDRKRKSSSKLRLSRRSSAKKMSSKSAESSLLSSRDSTLGDSLPDSRDTTLSSSYTPNTSTESRQSGLSPNLSSLSVSGTDTENQNEAEYQNEAENQKEATEFARFTEIPLKSRKVEETSIRQPFSKLQDANMETSSVPPVKKRKVEGGCKTTLEDLNIGDGILTRRRLPKVQIG